MKDRIVAGLTAARDHLTAALADEAFITAIATAAEAIAAAFTAGGKVLLAGNGGSAADAQHIAGEFVSRFNFDRAPLPAIALTTDTSILTAIGNDYGYEQVFARQVRGHGRPGDVLMVFSTSGRSPNVLAAIEAGRTAGLTVIGLTGGAGGAMADRCDILIRAPATHTPHIQQLHIAAAHLICESVEDRLFGDHRGQGHGQ